MGRLLAQMIAIGLLLSIPRAVAHSQESAPAVSPAARLKVALANTLPDIVAARQRGLTDEATIGVAIADATTGALLFEHNADLGFAAASNAKIVTAAAALDLLGPEFQFRTELLAETVDATGHIPGDLYIRGRGNASFDDADLARLVDDLKAQGVTRINGGVIVDNSYFDGENLPPHFDEQPSEHASFRSPIAATSLSFNAWTLVVRPSLSGAGAARVSLSPPNEYVKVSSSVSTVRSGRTRLRMQTTEEANRLSVSLGGQIRQEVRQRRFRKRVPDPVQFVGTGLKRALANAGIAVRKPKVSAGAAPESAIQLAVHESLSLAVMIRGMGKYSNNFVAELILKVLGAEVSALGQPATWDHGIQAVRSFLKKAGVKGEYRYENGSGLFDSNRFTPKQLVQVLLYAHREYRWSADFFSSLSISGADGTLSRRMSEGAALRQIRAKTGTLDHASALSGMAALKGQSPVVFSILVNGFSESSIGIARALQDDICEELVRSLGSR